MQAHSTAEENYVLADTHSERDPLTDPYGHASEPGEGRLCEDSSKSTIPESTFSYKLTEELFRAAKTAAPGSPESYWSHTLYRGPSQPDQDPPRVKVHYCTSRHTAERVISQYFMSEKVIGFDIEWKMDVSRLAGPKENVSVIQLASEERVALIHIALFAKDNISALVAPSFKKLMEDPSISKVGVNIKGDCTRLRNNLDIHSQGVFELSHLYKLVKFSESRDYKLINKKIVAMATQVLEHLHLPMFKGMDVRGSDWSKKLNMDQITYAAGDSYAGLQLYDVMNLKRTKLNPVPPLPYHAEQNRPIRLAEGIELDIDSVAEAEEEAVEPEMTSGAQRRERKARLPKSEIEEEFDLESDDSDPAFEPSQEFQTPLQTARTTSTRAVSKSPSKQAKTQHPLLIAAEATLTEYRGNLTHVNPKAQASNAHLRAYFVWSQNTDLTIQQVAGILRSPPLAARTVQSYILEAIKLDGKYIDDGNWDRERVKELLRSWKAGVGNQGWVARRYWQVEKDLETN